MNPLLEAFTEQELKDQFRKLGLGNNPAISAKICLEAVAAMGYKTSELSTPTEIKFTGLNDGL